MHPIAKQNVKVIIFIIINKYSKRRDLYFERKLWGFIKNNWWKLDKQQESTKLQILSTTNVLRISKRWIK